MKGWSEYWCLPLNPSKCEASFFSVDPHQAHLQSNILLRGFSPVSIPLQLFLGSPLTALPFFKHVSLLKAKFFPRLKALRCSSAYSWDPSKEPLSLLYKAFLWPLFKYALSGCFFSLSVININKSSSPIPLFLSEDSLPPLQVTLTHFTFSSSQRALRLPTSFPISGLAGLGVKPRLGRSSWTAFASTHLFVLPCTSPRKALLDCSPFPPWNLPSFTVESALSFSCSCFDLPLSRQDASLAHLEFSPPS